MSVAIVLFNRDLRVRDNPALAAAARAERTVPLFVLDEIEYPEPIVDHDEAVAHFLARRAPHSQRS